MFPSRIRGGFFAMVSSRRGVSLGALLGLDSLSEAIFAMGSNS